MERPNDAVTMAREIPRRIPADKSRTTRYQQLHTIGFLLRMRSFQGEQDALFFFLPAKFWNTGARLADVRLVCSIVPSPAFLFHPRPAPLQQRLTILHLAEKSKRKDDGKNYRQNNGEHPNGACGIAGNRGSISASGAGGFRAAAPPLAPRRDYGGELLASITRGHFR